MRLTVTLLASGALVAAPAAALAQAPSPNDTLPPLDQPSEPAGPGASVPPAWSVPVTPVPLQQSIPEPPPAPPVEALPPETPDGPTHVAPVIVQAPAEEDGKENNVAKTAGGVAGGLALGAAGAAVAGPIGKIAGGFIGKKIGKALIGGKKKDKGDDAAQVTVADAEGAAQPASGEVAEPMVPAADIAPPS